MLSSSPPLPAAVPSKTAGCPLCGGASAVADYDLSEGEGIPGLVGTCRECGFQYKRLTRPDRALDDYYADMSVYEFRDDEVEAEKEFQRILAALRAALPHGGRLLDIGSGPGRFLAGARRAGFDCTGVELNPGLAALARSETGVEVLAGSAEDLPRLLAGREEGYDAVTLLDFIEHVPDPVGLLRRAAAFLKPDGRMLVYTPNHAGLIVRTADLLYRMSGGRLDGPVRGVYDCDHIGFFTPATLRDAVRRAGLVAETMTMVKFNPARRNMAKGATAWALRLLEAASPFLLGEFRMILIVRRP